jgi:hypothetical protein
MVDIIVLASRTQLQLVCAEIQISVQDRGTISMLDHAIADQSLNHVAIRWYWTGSARWHSIHSHSDLRLLRVNVVDSVLLAGENVHSPLIILNKWVEG